MNNLTKLIIEKPLSVFNTFELALDLTAENFKLIVDAIYKPACLYMVSNIILQYCIAFFSKALIKFGGAANNLMSTSGSIFNLVVSFLFLWALFFSSVIALWFWFVKQLAVTKYICGFSESIESAQKSVDSNQKFLIVFNLLAILAITIVLVIIIAVLTFGIVAVSRYLSPALVAVAIIIYMLIVFFSVLFSGNLIISGNIIGCFESLNANKMYSTFKEFVSKYWWKMILAHLVYFLCILPVSMALVSPVSIINAVVAGLTFHANTATPEPNFFISVVNGFFQTVIHFYSFAVINFLYGLLYLSFKIKYCGIDLITKLDNIKNNTALQ